VQPFLSQVTKHHFRTFNATTNGRSSDEHKVFIELGCAATLTPAYEPKLMNGLRELIPVENGIRNAVFILCGGFNINLAEMNKFREALRRDLEAGDTSWECFCNGIQVTVEKTKTK
jgi:L-serine/L-threonine ammonia-lyase